MRFNDSAHDHKVYSLVIIILSFLYRKEEKDQTDFSLPRIIPGITSCFLNIIHGLMIRLLMNWLLFYA